jgi:Glycosyltransferase family 87
MSDDRTRRPAGGALASVVVGLACLVVLAAYARSVSAGRLTHGFVAYHTAARLLLEGQMGPHVYDQDWFRDEVQRRTSSRVLEIFGPNPPTMALLALPVAPFEPIAARELWLLISLIALAVATGVLMRDADASRAPFLPIAVAVVLISPAVFANLRTAQAYLIVGALFAGVAAWFSRGRDVAAGVCLGLAVILKTAGLPWLAVLAMARRWRALGTALATIVGIGVVTLPWTGVDTWRAYPSMVTAFVARPTTGLTAYQTTLSFARHWCGADAAAADGLAGCALGASLIAWLLLGAAVAVTAVAVRNAAPTFINAAGVCLSLLCVPIAEGHQFVLLAVPIAALATTTARWSWAPLVILLLIPAELTIERFTTGWLSFLAYPRLYAAWLLWALIIHAAARTPRKPAKEP